MSDADLQGLCELGQSQLMATRYLDAIATLSRAESIAWDAGDFDTLSRLYFPLQEARRQRRQRCGEGVVRLDVIPTGPNPNGDPGTDPDPAAVIARYPHGQLLVAGWGTVAPALRVRELAAAGGLYVEAFLAAAFPITGGGRAVAIVPTASARLPEPAERSIDALLALLPPHAIVTNVDALPVGDRPGTTATYAETMATWERLHAPHLAAADAHPDPLSRMRAYRHTITIDDACELAHQRLAAAARQLDRKRRNG